MPDQPVAVKTKRPRPPDDLEGEALLEWGRVCDELAAAGRLDTADRAVLHLYAETWSIWARATKHVNQFGPIVPGANKVVGKSPFYTVQRETAAQIRNLLADLGLTPQARGKATADPEDEAELKF